MPQTSWGIVSVKTEKEIVLLVAHPSPHHTAPLQNFPLQYHSECMPNGGRVSKPPVYDADFEVRLEV